MQRPASEKVRVRCGSRLRRDIVDAGVLGPVAGDGDDVIERLVEVIAGEDVLAANGAIQ
jgi:hypothetical protein